MNPLTLEWIKKAEGDLQTAHRELQARKAPNYDAACFHCQQAAEKYLKAVLQEAGQSIAKIHQLIELLALCVVLNPSYQEIYDELLGLERFAVNFRYPGEFADKSNAQEAYKAAIKVRNYIRTRLDIL